MKRPILGLLAAATLMFGVAGVAPAGATPDRSAAAVAPAHDGDSEGRHKHSHQHGGGQPTRHHDRQFHGDDHDDGHDHGDGDGHGRRRRCEGLIVICLV